MSIAATMIKNAVDHPLKKQFLKWQCLTRQIMMRDHQGQPTDAITPQLTVAGETEPLGHIITILNKQPEHSKLPEMLHLARKTNDPAQRRDQALQLLSETYFQKAGDFSDILTTTFPPGSPGAKTIMQAQRCQLQFGAYGQMWRLNCRVLVLDAKNPLFDATLAHNRLFNPNLPNRTMVLGFEPDWDASETSTG